MFISLLQTIDFLGLIVFMMVIRFEALWVRL